MRSPEQALHGERGLALLHGIVGRGVIGALVVEASHGQQVEHLLVHFLLGIDDVENHLLCVGSDGGHVEIEIYVRLFGRSADVHEAVHADVVRGERIAELQV